MAKETAADMGEQSMAVPAMQPHMNGGGHHYTQTNETQNCVIHYLRSADGTITESERVLTGGTGSGGYNPIVNRESTPNPFEGASRWAPALCSSTCPTRWCRFEARASSSECA